MFRLTRPSAAEIAAFRRAQAALTLSYADVGMTRGQAPRGFVTDHHRVVLGRGEWAWERAKSALRAWRMFDLGWVELHTPDAPIEAGTTVAVLAHSLGLWTLNATRIIHVVDEPRRFGFAYGTLPDHAECGEERFQVELGTDGSVTYDLLAYSRPQQALAKLAQPWVRRMQKRFAADSMRAMARATGE
jgi:uncharacterized protein (UPF0548 family)